MLTPQWLLISRDVLGPEHLYQPLPLGAGLCAGVEGGLEQLLPGERLQGGGGGQEGEQQQQHGDSDPQQDTDAVSLLSLFTQAHFIWPCQVSFENTLKILCTMIQQDKD